MKKLMITLLFTSSLVQATKPEEEEENYKKLHMDHVNNLAAVHRRMAGLYAPKRYPEKEAHLYDQYLFPGSKAHLDNIELGIQNLRQQRVLEGEGDQKSVLSDLVKNLPSIIHQSTLDMSLEDILVDFEKKEMQDCDVQTHKPLTLQSNVLNIALHERAEQEELKMPSIHSDISFMPEKKSEEKPERFVGCSGTDNCSIM